jgi:predicted transcriptional regulator
MKQENSLKMDSTLIRRKKIVTLDDLASSLHCSKRTVQRRLTRLKTIRSYNRNGQYFTLEGIGKFDANGLWHYRGTYFSKFGNLTQTFVQLVRASQAGLTSHESGDLIGLRPSSFLWNFHNHPEIKRQKHQGRYVYFSSEPARYAKQLQNRIIMRKTQRLPSEFEAIAILVEKIKHPQLSLEELADKLKRKKLYVEPEVIENLFLHHGLLTKKNHL